MEKDTVILSLRNYEELVGFKKAILEGKCARTRPGWGTFIDFLSTDEAMEEIIDENIRLRKDMDELAKEKNTALYELEELKKQKIRDISWMKLISEKLS